MQKMFSMTIFICLAAALCWPGTLSGAKPDPSKQTKKAPQSIKSVPAAGDKQPPGQSKGKSVLKPDLLITRIWLGQDCRIKMRIENQGQGQIQTADFIKGELEVRMNKETITYFLASPSGKGPAVDPSGRLKQPGSRITFIPGLTLAQRSLVRAEVDPGGIIEESNEKNNRNKQMFARVKCTPSKGRKISASQSIVPDQVDLSLDKLWLDKDCQLMLQITNQGPAGLSASEHKELRVQIRFGKQSRGFSLDQVDPEGKLDQVGGTVKFVTDIRLQNAKSVQVRANVEAAAQERNRADNRLAQVLKPSCGQELQAVKPAQARRLVDQDKPMPMKGRQVLETGSERKFRELDDSGGIRITRPQTGEVFHPGEQMAVTCEIISRELEEMMGNSNTQIAFELGWADRSTRLFGNVCSLTYVDYDWNADLNQYDLEVPENLEILGDEFYLYAYVINVPESPVYGKSNTFSILPERNYSIDFLSPSGEITIGETFQVSTLFPQEVNAGPVVFKLFRVGYYNDTSIRPLLTTTRPYQSGSTQRYFRSSGHDVERRYDITLNIRDSNTGTLHTPLSEGAYFLTATHEEAFGISPYFLLLRPETEAVGDSDLFLDSESLDPDRRGLLVGPEQTVSKRIVLAVHWNGQNPPGEYYTILPNGSSYAPDYRITVQSIRTGENLISEGDYSFDFAPEAFGPDDEARFGIPLEFEKDRISELINMSRGQFIPVEIRLEPVGHHADADLSNNVIQDEIRLHNAQIADLELNMEDDIQITDGEEVRVRVRVRNLSRNDAEAIQHIDDVPIRLRFKPISYENWYRTVDDTISSGVGEEWVEFDMHFNYPFRSNFSQRVMVEVEVDPEHILIDGNRYNNKMVFRFNISPNP